MLKVKTKYDYREELCQALETGKYIKATYIFVVDDNLVCAIGAFGSLTGLMDKSFNKLGIIQKAEILHTIETLLGITVKEREKIQTINDSTRGWSEVVKYIRNLP